MRRRPDPLLVGLLIVATVLFGWGIWRVAPHQLNGDEWSGVAKGLLMTYHTPVTPTFRKGGNLHDRVLAFTNLLLSGYWFLTGVLPTVIEGSRIYARAVPLDPSPLLSAYYDAVLAGRAVSVAAAVGAVYATVGLTRELATRRAGLLAGATLAASVGFAAIVHFATEDALQIALIVATLWLLVRAIDGDDQRTLQLAALVGGLAVSAKATSGALIAPFALVVYQQRRGWRPTARLAAELAGLAALAYVVTTPSLIAYPLAWATQVARYAGLSVTTIPFEGARPHPNPGWLVATVHLARSLGALLFAVGAGAVAATTWGTVRRRYDRRLAVVLAFGAAYGLLMLPPRMPQYPRLMVLHPVVAVCVGVVAADALDAPPISLRRLAGYGMAVVILISAVSTGLYITDFGTSRADATAWADDELAAGATVDTYGYRVYRPELPADVDHRVYWLNDPRQPAERATALDRIRRGCPDYVILSSRYYGRFLNSPDRFPASTTLVRSLLFGDSPYHRVARFGPPVVQDYTIDAKAFRSLNYPPRVLVGDANPTIVVLKRRDGVHPTNCRTE